MSKRNSILAAIATTLSGTSGANAVYRSRTDAVRREEMPIIIVDWTADDPTMTFNDYVDWLLQVRVTFLVRSDIPDNAADAMISSAYGLLMNDRTIGGLAMNLEPSRVTNEAMQGDLTQGVITHMFNVTYRIPVKTM